MKDIATGLVMMLFTWTGAPVVLFIALGLTIRLVWPRRPVRAWDEAGDEVDPPKQTLF